MSASPVARQATQSQSIPSRHVVLNDPSQLPNDYSTTPGGTLYSTTPGGTRIVYDRSVLLNLRNSPVARTPPKNLPNIPGIMPGGSSPSKSPSKTHSHATTAKLLPPSPKQNGNIPTIPEKKEPDHQEPQFEMDI